MSGMVHTNVFRMALASKLQRFAITGLLWGALAVAGAPVAGSAIAQPAAPVSLEQFIRAALERDPEFLAAKAARDAGIENENIGLAGLLPSVTVTASEYPDSETKGRTNFSGRTGSWSTTTYDSSNRSLIIRQPVIRLRNWAAYLQGASQADQAEARLRFAKYQTILRATELYRDHLVLGAELNALKSQLAFWQARAKQLDEMRSKGLAPITDALEATAEESNIQRELAAKEKELAFVKSKFELIVGDKSQPLRAQIAVPSQSPGNTTQELLDQVLKHNPELKAAEEGIRIAKYELRKVNADHFPTVDLVGNRTYENSASSTSIGRESKTSNLGLQLTVPIFQGGQVTSSARQAAANLRRAEFDAQVVRHRLQNDIARVLGEIDTAIKHIEYARRLSRYADTNLVAIRQQQSLGFKTSPDLLQAEFLKQKSVAEEVAAQYAWVAAEIALTALQGSLETVHQQKKTSLFFQSGL
jgi:protease secretion system outer membrane protein